jgi:hypothetical protein
MQMTNRILITLGILLVFSASVTGQGRKTSSPTATELASINAYVKQVDRFVKRNDKRRRIFGNVGNEEDQWREFKGKVAKGETDPADLDEAAYVWARKGRVIAAYFAFQSGSRDWGHFVTYYFREDGSLAKIHSQLNTFYGNVSAFRDKYYSSNGRLFRTTTRYLDLDTKKPKKNPNFHDEPIPVYLSVRKLPFFKLL